MAGAGPTAHYTLLRRRLVLVFALLYPLTIQFREILDVHVVVGEMGDYPQLAAHCFNEPAQRAHVHVGSLFNFRDGRLTYTEDLRKFFLRQRPGSSKLSQVHVPT